MAINIKETGFMTCKMGKEHQKYRIQKEPTKETGKMENQMEKDKLSMKMVPNIKATFNMERKMVWEY